MQLESRRIGIGRRLTHIEQRAYLTEQVIPDPGQHSFSGPVEISHALPRVFIRQEAAPFLRKRNAIPIDWDSVSLIREEAVVLPLASDLDLLFVVKTCLSAGIIKDKLRGFSELATPGTEQNLVPPIAPVKLPGRLEELEELTHNRIF